MKRQVQLGKTDYSVLVFIPDPASTDGSGKTGLAAANLTVSGVRVETDNDVTVTDYTSSLNDLTALTDAHNDWGLKEVSSTLAPGLYRLDIADAIFASGAWTAVVYVMITSSAAAPSPMEFVLVAHDPDDLGTKQSGDSYARIGANGASLSAIPWNAAWDAEVESEATDALNAYDPPTNAEMVARTLASASYANATDQASILADTNELQTDWADGGRLDLILDARASQTSVDDVPTAAENATAVWGAAARTLTAIDEDSTTLDLDATIRSAVGLASANLDTQIGDLPTNAELATALGTADDAVLAQVALVKAVTDKLDDTLEDDAGTFRFTTNALEQAPSGSGASAADIADAVWDEALAGHAGVGSAGAALSAAGSAGDPWSTPLPGAYGSGTAGKIVGDNINATISSRATQTSVDDLPTNAELATALGTADDAVLTQVALVKAKTDLIPASPAAVSDIPTAVQNADALLGRNIAGGSNGGRMVKDALRPLRNKVGIVTGTMTVYAEDDSTPAWTAAVTTTAGDPLSEIDPA